jgi:hypothetical protein
MALHEQEAKQQSELQVHAQQIYRSLHYITF